MKQITSINSWHKISPDSENNEWPSARSGHSCVIFRDLFLYIFGGMDENDSLRDMYEYNILNNKWRKIEPKDKVCPSARASHAMVSIDQISKLYLSGGIDSNQTFKKDLWEFDIINNIWKVKKIAQGDFSFDRYGHTMNYYRNYILFFGGAKLNQTTKLPEFPNELYQYNLLNNQFKPIATTGTIPQGRFKHSTLILQDNFYVIGGYTNQIRFGNISKLDLNTRIWSNISFYKPQQPNPKADNSILFKGRYGFAVYYDNQKIFIYGGNDDEPRGDMLRLDLEKKEWIKHKAIGEFPAIREYFGFASSESALFIFGGRQNQKRMNDLFIFQSRYDNFSYKLCSLRDDIKSLLFMDPQESLANVEISCSSFSEKESQTFYAHDFLLKFRWRSLYAKISQKDLKVQLKIEPKLLGLILEFIYSGELVLNHLTVKELLNLLEFTIKHDIELIVSLILNHLLLSTQNDNEITNSGLNAIFIQESEKEKENKNTKLSANLEKLKIATKIQSFLQGKKTTKLTNDENERKASELWWDKIYVSQEKIIENFYQDLQKIYLDQTLTDFKIETESGQEFSVHLPILIARSQYFQAINEMQMDEVNQGRLKVQNILENKTFGKLLEYFYMGFYSIREDSSFDHHEALDLLKMANYFDLKTPSLNLLMENYVMETITQNSCLEILDLSDKMNFYQLKMKSLDFICRNYKDIINTNLKTFEQFPKPLLIEIMQHLANYTS